MIQCHNVDCLYACSMDSSHSMNILRYICELSEQSFQQSSSFKEPLAKDLSENSTFLYACCKVDMVVYIFFSVFEVTDSSKYIRIALDDVDHE